MILSDRDNKRLVGVHPDLVKVVERVALFGGVSFMVLEGVRTLEKQKEYFAAGKSKTMKSRHLTGHAVDLAPLVDLDGDGDKELSWNMKHFLPLAEAVKQASILLDIPIRWGGSWKRLADMPTINMAAVSRSFPDGPHFELPA
jgi:peptidoglycan L-alanyl-D-glutamate endopeptidase CwlK